MIFRKLERIPEAYFRGLLKLINDEDVEWDEIELEFDLHADLEAAL